MSYLKDEHRKRKVFWSMFYFYFMLISGFAFHFKDIFTGMGINYQFQWDIIEMTGILVNPY